MRVDVDVDVDVSGCGCGCGCERMWVDGWMDEAVTHHPAACFSRAPSNMPSHPTYSSQPPFLFPSSSPPSPQQSSQFTPPSGLLFLQSIDFLVFQTIPHSFSQIFCFSIR